MWLAQNQELKPGAQKQALGSAFPTAPWDPKSLAGRQLCLQSVVAPKGKERGGVDHLRVS